jgi:hypothetical protein
MTFHRHCERKRSNPASRRARILDCFVAFAPRNDVGARPRSRGAKRPSSGQTPPSMKRAQGMPGARNAPAASRAETKQHTSSVTTGTPHQPAFPARWFYAFLRALPGDRAFLSPSSAEVRSADLIPASRNQDHTASPSASGGARLAHPKRPSHPALHVRDDAQRPPDERGTGVLYCCFYQLTKRNIFLRRSGQAKSA